MSFDFSPIYAGQSVLITGGAGFIGSNLACRLAQLGAVVTVVDSFVPDYGGNLFNLAKCQNSIRLNIADVRDQHSMNYLVRDQGFLFNLAGQISHTDSMRDPYTDLDINARAQLSILEACRKYNTNIRILFASTRQIYGKPLACPVNEQHPLQPVDVNGINKIAGEHYHMLYGAIYGMPVTSLRLTNIFGPHMRIKDARQTFIGWWLRQIVEGKTIQIFGDGKQVRDLNYVDDVVDAMLLAASAPAAVGQIYNLGGEPISLLELAQLMISIDGRSDYEVVPFPPERKAIDIGDYWGDYTKIHTQLGWKPQVSLREGLTRTLLYYREHLDKYL